MAGEKKRVHIARILTDKGGRVWVLFDEEHTLLGKQGERRKALLRRWQEAHGKAAVLVRITGMCRPSELAMLISDLQRERSQRTCSWCHHVNEVTDAPAFCKKCGHRADAPRLECDCEQCKPSTSAPGSKDTGGNES